MTDYREQAIRDVAEAFLRSTGYINDCLVKPYTCDDERIAYAVAQRERLLGLEALVARLTARVSPAEMYEFGHETEDAHRACWNEQIDRLIAARTKQVA